MSYIDIYKKRLNRYGLDYQSRIQGEREQLFDNYLLKSIYRVDFWFDGDFIPGSLEKYKQDETKTLQYLLVKRDVEIPSGTVLMIAHKEDHDRRPWMVYYLEDIKASGYNRYILLKMSHMIEWTARDGSRQKSWAYMYGQENNMLKDELKSRSRSRAIYDENLKSSFFIMPKNPYIKKDIYLEVGENEYKEGYRVTGYDLQSTEGVMFVTIDPVYLYDLSEKPVQTEEDSDDDFYWLNNGGEE